MDEGLARKEEEEAREYRLKQAIANDDVAKVHELLAEERELLDRVSKHPFPNTPLHLAAAAGKTQVAMEMAILRPSFARKLNVEGYSPMHLALQHENYKTVRALMTIDTELIRVRGRCGITPLHYVAKKEGENELELLAEFLCACKSSIKVLTSRCETAVHIAMKNNNIKAFKVLFGWLERVCLTEILNQKDEDGNTVLDIAESKVQSEIVKLLKELGKMKAQNLLDKTGREISQLNPDGDEHLEKESQPSTSDLSSPGPLRREETFYDKIASFCGSRNKSAREMILLVAGLTASASYQAALTPPGRFWQDNSSNPLANSTAVTANSSGVAVGKLHEAGQLILSGSKLYNFSILNSTVFLASIATILMSAMTLLPHTILVYLLTSYYGYAYVTILTTGFPNPDADRVWSLNATFLYLAMVVPILLRFIHWRRVRTILKPNDPV